MTLSAMISSAATLFAVVAHAAALASTPLPPHVSSDDAQQRVIYIEQSGSTGSAAEPKIKACRSSCPSPVSPRPCRVEGNPQRDGEFVARSWRSTYAATRYTEAWALGNDDGDVCVLKLKTVRTLRITTFDGNASTLISINLDRGGGTRRVIVGRPGALAIDPAKGLAALRTSGYEPAGTSSYAGYTCRVLRKSAGQLVQDACLLDDTSAPATVLELPTHLMPLAESTVSSKPERRIYSETHLLKFDAVAPVGVFSPPASVRLKEVK